MKLLLDTHVLVWWTSNADLLSPKAYELLMDYNNTLLLSFASVWEIQIKLQMGKIKLNLPIKDLIANQQEVNKLELLPIELKHIYSLNNLPKSHGDCFNRMIGSQAIVENIPIVSIDNAFDLYPVKRIWS